MHERGEDERDPVRFLVIRWWCGKVHDGDFRGLSLLAGGLHEQADAFDLLALQLVHDAEHGFVLDALVADDEYRLLGVLALRFDDGL